MTFVAPEYPCVRCHKNPSSGKERRVGIRYGNGPNDFICVGYYDTDEEGIAVAEKLIVPNNVSATKRKVNTFLKQRDRRTKENRLRMSNARQRMVQLAETLWNMGDVESITVRAHRLNNEDYEARIPLPVPYDSADIQT